MTTTAVPAPVQVSAGVSPAFSTARVRSAPSRPCSVRPAWLTCGQCPHTLNHLRIPAQSWPVPNRRKQSSDGLLTDSASYPDNTGGRMRANAATALSPSIRTTGRNDPMSTLTSAVQMSRDADRLGRHLDALAATVAAMAAPPEMSDLEDLEAQAETAETIFEIAGREMDAAREQLEEARKRAEAASDEWTRAGAAMDEARRALGAARRAAGVVVTANGVRPAVQS
jgi:hypothetical protein